MKIVAFDLAPLHLAIRGEKIDKGTHKPLIFELTSFGSKQIDRELMTEVIAYLDTFDFASYDVVLLERQLNYRGFGKGMSPINSKLQHVFETYFLIKYPEIPVVLIQPSSKYPQWIRGSKKIETSPTVPEAFQGKKASDHLRKRWAILRVKEIFEERNDQKSLVVIKDAQKIEKADDLADAVLLIIAYLQQNAK
jgi:hypothetical protein